MVFYWMLRCSYGSYSTGGLIAGKRSGSLRELFSTNNKLFGQSGKLSNFDHGGSMADHYNDGGGGIAYG